MLQQDEPSLDKTDQQEEEIKRLAKENQYVRQKVQFFKALTTNLKMDLISKCVNTYNWDWNYSEGTHIQSLSDNKIVVIKNTNNQYRMVVQNPLNDDNLNWSITNKGYVYSVQKLDANRFAFSSDGENSNRLIHIWDEQSKTLSVLIPENQKSLHNGPIISLQLLSDNILLSGSRDNVMRIWNINGKKDMNNVIKIKCIAQKLTPQMAIDFMQYMDNNLVVIASNVSNGNKLYVWELRSIYEHAEFTDSKQPRFTFKPYNSTGIQCIQSLSKGLLACGFKDGGIEVWKIDYDPLLAKPELISSLSARTQSSIKCLRYLPGSAFQSDFLISGLENGQVDIWDFKNKECREPVVTLAQHSKPIQCLELFNNSSNVYLITGAQGERFKKWQIDKFLHYAQNKMVANLKEALELPPQCTIN